MSGCRRTSILSTFRLSLSLPVTKAILPLSYGSQGLSGGRWASQRRLRSSEDSRRRARRGGGRLAAMRATDRHIGAAQVLRRPRPAVQWLQVWASGIRAPRRAQHGRAACAAAKLGPPVKDDGQRYARQKNLPSTQDLETPSMGRSEPYNGEAAGGVAWGNEPTPSPHEATRVPSSRCVRVLCVKLTSYRRLATPRCTCPKEAIVLSGHLGKRLRAICAGAVYISSEKQHKSSCWML